MRRVRGTMWQGPAVSGINRIVLYTRKVHTYEVKSFECSGSQVMLHEAVRRGRLLQEKLE